MWDLATIKRMNGNTEPLPSITYGEYRAQKLARMVDVDVDADRRTVRSLHTRLAAWWGGHHREYASPLSAMLAKLAQPHPAGSRHLVFFRDPRSTRPVL
jgi:hypothetical protein